MVRNILLQKPYSIFYMSLATLFFLVASLVVLLPNSVKAEDSPAIHPAIPTADQLWARAEVAGDKGDYKKSAILYLRLNEYYPDDERGESALWKSGQLYKKIAEASADPDWEQVRDVFRKFPINYPKSSHAGEAYLELGKAHFKMRFLRESLMYVNLFLQRYPRSPLRPQGFYWQARTLFEIGKNRKAETIFKKLITGADITLSHQASFALVDLYFAEAKYKSVLAVLAKIVDEIPAQSPVYLEVLKSQGLALVHLASRDEIKKGRKLLYYYFNVAKSPKYKQRVLFALAESYYRAADQQTAQRLYGVALAQEVKSDKISIFCRFRQAQYRDDPNRKLKKWQRKEKVGSFDDDPYLAVLDNYSHDPIAQDARLALVARYMARKDYQRVYELGKIYISKGKGRKVAEVYESLGKVLILRIEQLLAQEEYSKVYELYRKEYRYVSEYSDGRLLFLVGQALESLGLYDQASVVYYRALSRKLSDKDKMALYLRRAGVYLVSKDLVAAERLLKYLRGEFSGDMEIGEIYFLSGRLRDLQQRHGEALAFYGKAVQIAKLADNRGRYALVHLEKLLGIGKVDTTASLLAEYRKKNWLHGVRLQEILGRLGDVYYQNKDYILAQEVYLPALAKGMPQKGERVQVMRLNLGDIYCRQGKSKQCLDYFKQASVGENERWNKVAHERIKQSEIELAVQEVKGTLGIAAN